MFFAGIVLYNPNMNRLIENIISIKNQVDCIVCVDNNSNNYKEIKDKFGNDINIILISNFENKGIGYALNQIVRWGIKHDYQWVLTLDQDSICPPDIIEKYTEYINEKLELFHH
jgi:rhamnosyltransferase